jgi:hypothetical protein
VYIEDLQKFPASHHPSPYDFPVPVQKHGKWGYGLLPSGMTLCAVGWLGSSVKHRNAPVLAGCIDSLFKAYLNGLVISDGTMGWHNCELCVGDDKWYPGGQIGPIIQWRGERLRLYGHGHNLIRSGDLVYMCPALILHYILDHKYVPPDEFIQSVPRGQFLTQDDLIWVEAEA